MRKNKLDICIERIAELESSLKDLLINIEVMQKTINVLNERLSEDRPFRGTRDLLILEGPRIGPIETHGEVTFKPIKDDRDYPQSSYISSYPQRYALVFDVIVTSERVFSIPSFIGQIVTFSLRKPGSISRIAGKFYLNRITCQSDQDGVITLRGEGTVTEYRNRNIHYGDYTYMAHI